MYSYGEQSRLRLNYSNDKLQATFFDAIEVVDIVILCGHRSIEEQDKLFESGASKVRGGASKHNRHPSHAIDAAPWPIPDEWGEGEVNKKEWARFHHLAGIIQGIGLSKYNTRIRWGGDWDSDGKFKDQTWDDLIHYELL